MLTPTHWTDKPAGARTRGPAATKLVRALTGTELMEWQRAALDVAFAYDPSSGLWCFPTVVVSVPRQNGKTIGVMKPAVLDRLMFTEGERTLGTSHKLAGARDVLFNPLAADLSPYAGTGRTVGPGARLGSLTIKYSMGSETIRVNRRPASRTSEFRLIAPTPKAAHGYSAATVLIDEAWAFETDELEQAITPTQTAQRNPQLIVVSTAGHEGSRFLRRLVELGRADAPGVAYLEWSAPADADPHDPATWAAANPAYGVTITERVMRSIHDRMVAGGELAGFERAHLNRWTGSVAPTIPAHAWLACRAAAPSYVDRETPIAFGADVALDRSAAAVGAAIARPDGRVAVELVKTGDGTEWLAGELAGLVARHPGRRLVVDRIGPMAPIVAMLERDRVPHTLVRTADYTAASAGFLDAVTAGQLTHPADPDLDAAVAAASQRAIGEAWAWGRRASSANIAPLVAVTLARWGLISPPPFETPRVLY
jgi:hypothetical protein